MYYCHKLLQSLDQAFGVGIASATNNPARQRILDSITVLRSRVSGTRIAFLDLMFLLPSLLHS